MLSIIKKKIINITKRRQKKQKQQKQQKQKQKKQQQKQQKQKQKKQNKLMNNIKVVTNISHYRVGDVVMKLGKPHRWRSSRENILKLDKYNGTVLKEYFKKINPKKDPNWELLLKLLLSNKKAGKYPQPSKNTIVIHWRCGDAYGRDKEIQKVINQVKNLKNNSIKDICIVTQLSFGNDIENSEFNCWKYSNKKEKNARNILNKLIKILTKNNFNVSIAPQGTADNHLRYMVLADFFIHSSGGFGKIVTKLRSIR